MSRLPITDWTIRKTEPTEWEYHDGDRVRALLQQRRGEPSPWVVHRINSLGRITGCDSFRSKVEAHDFITDGRIFWRAQ